MKNWDKVGPHPLLIGLNKEEKESFIFFGANKQISVTSKLIY